MEIKRVIYYCLVQTKKYKAYCYMNCVVCTTVVMLTGALKQEKKTEEQFEMILQ